MNKKKLSHSNLNSSITSVLAALLCIVIGMAVGFLVLLAINPAHAWGDGFVRIVKGGFHDAPYGVGKELANAAPLVMTGLSVGFAFKTGLFNIGAAGQYCFGVALSLYAALGLGWSWLPCMLLAILGGALLAGISGLLKSYCNVNEVISGIMLNWIVYYLTGLIGSNLPDAWIDKNNNTKLTIMPKTGRLPSLAGPGIFEDVTWGLIIAAVIAIIIWFILRYTKFGFELKLCGSNKCWYKPKW